MELRWLALGMLCLTAACGPGDLPGFANPPPDDAGVRARKHASEDRDAADDDEDAGRSDGGRREIDVSDAAAN
jgi:hypothetical protein